VGRDTRSSNEERGRKEGRCAWIDEVVLSNAVVSGGRWFRSPAAAQDTPKAEVSLGYNWFGAKQSAPTIGRSFRRDGTPTSPATSQTH
jgi:hypothetical protein